MSEQTQRHYSEYGFADPENAKRYAAGTPLNFFPGFSVMHDLALQLLRESMGPDGNLLVLGAGGGLELKAFAEAQVGWQFTAVDPSPEMIAAGKTNLATEVDRITWVEGYASDMPDGPFDGATCLLTLHLIPDNGLKLETLKCIRRRLKPGARFILVDNCYDKTAPDFERVIDRFVAHALNRGVPEDLLETVRVSVTEKTESISAEREAALLSEAGFKEVDLFYAALSWRGWVAIA